MGSLIYIEKDDKIEANKFSQGFALQGIKTRTYINALGVKLASKYLLQEGIVMSDLYNLHDVAKIREEFDIADIQLPNIHIDVRMTYDESCIFIPKTHFEYGIKPDIYLVFCLQAETSYIDFLGFFETKELDKSNVNNDYYFIKNEDLLPPEKLKDFILNFENKETVTFTLDEIEMSKSLMLNFLDNSISREDKKILFSNLLKSLTLRKTFIKFANFEKLSYLATADSDSDWSTISANIIAHNDIEKNVKDEFDEFDKFDELGDLSAVVSDMNSEIINIAEPQFETEITENLQSDIEPQNIEVETGNFDNEALEEPEDSFESDTEMELEENITDEVELEDVTMDESDMFTLGDSDDIEPQNIEVETENFDKEDLEESEDSFESDTEMALEENITDEVELEDVTMDESDMFTLGDSDDIEPQNIEVETENFDKEDLEESEDSFESDTEMALEENITDEVKLEDVTMDESDMFTLGDSDDIEPQNVEVETENFDNEALEEPEDSFESVENNDIENLSDTVEFDNSIVNEEETSIENEISTSNDALVEMENINVTVEQPKDVQNEYGFVDLDNLANNNIELQTNETESNENETTENEVVETFSLDQLAIRNSEPVEQSKEENLINNDSLDYATVQDIVDTDSQQDESHTDEINLLYEDASDDSLSDISDNYVPSETLNGKKIMGITAFVVAVLTALLIHTSLHKTSNKISEQDNSQPLEAKLPEDIDTPLPDNISESKLITSDNVAEVNSGINYANKRVAVSHSPSSYLSVKNVSWSVPAYISYNSNFSEYLHVLGKNVKLSLMSDLLLVDDAVSAKQVQVGITLNQAGNLRDIKVIQTSGSQDVDNLIIKSLKEGMNVIKAPSNIIVGDIHLVFKVLL